MTQSISSCWMMTREHIVVQACIINGNGNSATQPRAFVNTTTEFLYDKL